MAVCRLTHSSTRSPITHCYHLPSGNSMIASNKHFHQGSIEEGSAADTPAKHCRCGLACEQQHARVRRVQRADPEWLQPLLELLHLLLGDGDLLERPRAVLVYPLNCLRFAGWRPCAETSKLPRPGSTCQDAAECRPTSRKYVRIRGTESIGAHRFLGLKHAPLAMASTHWVAAGRLQMGAASG